jgi:2,4-dienoyl-CoA reductase-like NADH-dependent reductase (Old Yellow Enzyme family)
MSELQILSKVTVGDQEFRNRVVLAPLTRAR